MFKNEKGFTLVELLAVIVILAIILAIAVPGISGVITNSKKGSFESDAKMILSSLENQKLQASTGTSDVTVDIGALTVTEIGKLGASSANYASITITDDDPLTVTVVGSSSGKFGAYTFTGTRSSYTVTP